MDSKQMIRRGIGASANAVAMIWPWLEMMSVSLIKVRPPRWYRDSNGVVEACYQLPKKNGNGVKEPTLREARELGLLPSVTTILNVMAKPGLERWKLEQAIHSALTLPRVDGEGEDAFAARIAQDMEAQSLKAAEFGTRIHDAIARLLSNPDIKKMGVLPTKNAMYEDTLPFLESFYKWAQENIEEVHAVEQIVGGKQVGYAGRMDLDCTLKGVGRCVVDFKSQGIREGKEPVFYDEWKAQLAAYLMASPARHTASLVIDNRVPGPVHVKIWTEDEFSNGWRMFQHCFELWKISNDYIPNSIFTGRVR